MYQTILFDLDGTLTDSKEGITKCVQYALSKCGISEPNLDRLESFIGPPLKQHLRERYPDLTEEEAGRALEWYRERFRTVGLFENQLYNGVPELLENLRDAGRTLVLATSKPTIFTKRILNHFAIDRYFQVVVGSELDGRRGEKSEVIEEALRRVSVGGHQAVMVGDRKYDMLGAKKWGLSTIGVLYGYGSREELQSAGADWLVPDIPSLERLLLEERSG